MVFHRLTMKKACVLLLLPGAILLYASFQASRAFLYTSSTRGSFVLNSWHRDPQKRDPPEKNDGGGKIILMTYGRSGSSFTSEIIQRDPNVFYSFEPLYNLHRRIFSQKGVKFKPSASNSTNDLATYNKESIELLETFLTCTFETMVMSDINNFQLRNSADSRLLWGCVQKGRNLSASAAVECFINARKTCQNRRVKLAKTIRLRGTAARQMMDKHDDLKLLYLVRDPRGTISSQRRVFNTFKWDNVHNFSAGYCETFRQDLVEVEQFIDRYPERVKILRYESLAADPIKVSEEMYQFLGLNFTAGVREFVFNKTMAGQKSKSAYGTSRGNSTETAYSWRKKMTLAAAQTIDNNCWDIYVKLGYVPVESTKDLLGDSARLIKSVTFHGKTL